MKLSEIEATLRKIKVSPVKSMGQNFLHDQNLARWIVQKADLTPDDYVVEVGPGLGALTAFILESGARVLAIEKDQRLVNYLQKRFTTDRLQILHCDALDYDVRRLFGKPKVKLLGNLPYNISTQLLLKYINYPSPIILSLLMLQKEVARRLSAQPRNSEYGALTLITQLHNNVEYLRTVPTTVFLPQPEVDSAFVRISPRTPAELTVTDPATFSTLVRTGFSQRRKQLRKLLSTEIRDWDNVAATLKFDPRARAEELSLEQWVGLANLTNCGAAKAAPLELLERLAVVDEQDTVQGEATRGQIHGNNLRHRAVHILVFNHLGELFLQKRSRWKDRHPLLWDSSAAGHVEADEDYDSAAGREVREELGVTTELTPKCKLPASEETGNEFIWVYVARHNGPFQMPPAEIEYGDFFPVDVVSEWLEARPKDFAPGFVACWRALQMSGAPQNSPELRGDRAAGNLT